jgi:signal transduction histidine kinase/ActR/RegA family two-component response regulator
MVEGVVLHDASGGVVWCNPSAARILGPSVLLPAGSGATETPYRAIREDGDEVPWQAHPVMVALRTGRAQRDIVMGIVRPDGTRSWVSVNAEPVRGKASATSVVASYADITAIRDGGVKLRALESQLRHAQKMEAIGQLTGGIAHDFNNLLTAILTNADLLTDVIPDAPSEAREELDDLRRAARRGAELVRQLMTFSRRDRVELMRVDVSDLLWSAARLLRRVVPEHIELQTQVEKGLPSIQADPAGIEQVLVNLATNARDAMPKGGVLRIQAELRVMEAAECETIGWGRPGPYVCLEVSDDGVGMDAGTLERMYDPFYTTKPVGQGTGLGMSIVYGVVQQHEAYIHVESAPGKGTRVQLRFLPVEAEAPSGETQDAADIARGTETVLLVEDNEGVRAAARRILERCGYRVLTATNGADALQLYQVHRDEVRLLLADVVMPRMSGIELAEALRRQGAPVKILLTSGYTQRAADATALGATILPKPWTPRQLAERVRETLDAVEPEPEAR